MTRDEEIKEAAWNSSNYGDCDKDKQVTARMAELFINGANYADKHPAWENKGTLVLKDIHLTEKDIEELNKPRPITIVSTPKLKPTKVNAFEQMTFDVNTPQFLKEACENCEHGMYSIVWNIFRQLIVDVAERATELQDPVLDALMIKLNLYEMPNSERRKMIKILEQNYKEQIYVGNTKHSNSEN